MDGEGLGNGSQEIIVQNWNLSGSCGERWAFMSRMAEKTGGPASLPWADPQRENGWRENPTHTFSLRYHFKRSMGWTHYFLELDIDSQEIVAPGASWKRNLFKSCARLLHHLLSSNSAPTRGRTIEFLVLRVTPWWRVDVGVDDYQRK